MRVTSSPQSEVLLYFEYVPLPMSIAVYTIIAMCGSFQRISHGGGGAHAIRKPDPWYFF